MNEEVRNLLKELATFPGREEALRKIKRWSLYETMFYRSSLFSHSKRITYLITHVEPLMSTILKPFDMRRTLALAFTHDDAEIITGDYQAGNKAKMTPEQLKKIEDEEREAIKVLATRFPKTVGGYSYQELLEDMVDLHSREAQVAKYFDMLDAQGEGLHEVEAGNSVIATHAVNELGVIPRFDEVYNARQSKMIDRYEPLRTLKNKHLFFKPFAPPRWDALPAQKPHTAKTIKQPGGHPLYDEWKKAVLESNDSEEIENLYTQREFI